MYAIAEKLVLDAEPDRKCSFRFACPLCIVLADTTRVIFSVQSL